MELKITQADGTPGVLEVPEGAQVDFKAMGVLSTEEVDALKARAIQQGKTAVQGELEAARMELENNKQKLQKFEGSLTEKQKQEMEANGQIEALSKTVEELKSNLEKEAGERARAQEAVDLRQAMDGVQLVQDAFQYLEQFVASKKVQGGYQAADGTTVDMKAVASEWLESPIGKNLTKTTDLGGGGTDAPTGAGMSFQSVKNNPAKLAEVKAKLGAEGFTKWIAEGVKKK